MRVNSREARQWFSELLDRAERGEDIIIERRGRSPVRLVSIANESRPRFPDLSAFRESVEIDGTLSDAVIAGREGGSPRPRAQPASGRRNNT